MTILCVGQNYAKHAAEMGSVAAAEPIWFLKPDASIIGDGDNIVVPPGIGEVHHEVELAIRIGRDGQPDAMTVAIDVTARDLQKAAKAAGRPWTQAKGYDTFCALGAWVPLADDLQDLTIRLAIDGAQRQVGHTKDMTWSVAALLERARWMTLRGGDILLTGTPEGVGPIVPGQRIEASIDGHVVATFGVA